jgi:hypothetical protein
MLEPMRCRGARTAAIAVGAVLAIVGLVWVGQGLNVIPGSFMTGVRTWFYIGLVLILVGVVLIVLGVRKRSGGHA